MKKNKKFKKMFGCMMSLFLIFTLLSGCSEDLYDDYEDYEDYEGEYEEGDGTDYSLLSPDGVSMNKVLTVDKNTGEMTINRPKHDPEVPMGEDGTWTIFVYLCGSDLESDGGAATDDLVEMQSASTSDNVRFVVETGGASSWSNEYAASDALHRFVIQNEEITELEPVENRSMGDTATLTDFLRWGIKEYPAEHMVCRHYGVRTKRYSLIHFYDDIDAWELYDLKKDPEQMHNIYGQPGTEKITKKLRDELHRLQEQYDDPIRFTVKDN